MEMEKWFLCSVLHYPLNDLQLMDIKWTLTEKTNKQLISSQHAFTKSCLNNFINFYDKMTVFVD